MQYVTLPDIKKLEIGKFELYKNNYFNWNFNNDMNLFLGINGLGKTTTIKTLAYAIVGLSNEKKENELSKKEIRAIEGLESKSEVKEFTEIKDVGISDKNYFRRYKTINENPYVKVKFSLKDKIFELKRNLLSHDIEYLRIGENEFNKDLEQNYVKFFEMYSGIELKNFKKILYTLLIRTEEAPSLLFRPTIQHIVLRTLLFEKDFHVQFLSSEKRLRAAESDYRHNIFELSNLETAISNKKDDIEKISKEIDTLYNELSDENKKQIQKLSELESRKEELIENEDTISGYSNKLIEEIDKLSAELSRLELEKSELEYKLQSKDDEIINLKSQLYSDIYCEDDIYTLALNALIERRSCIFCNATNISENEVRRIRTSISKGKCSFCNSTISDSSDINNENSASELYELKKELIEEKKNISNILIKVNENINNVKLRINELNIDNEKKIKDVLEIQRELIVIKNLINGVRINNISKDDDETINKSIDEKRKEIARLGASIEVDKKNYNNLIVDTFGELIDYKKEVDNKDEVKKELIGGKKKEYLDLRKAYEQLVAAADNNIKNIEEKLISKFNKYNILNNFCLHRIISKNIDKNVSSIKYSTFVPKNTLQDNSYGKEDIRDSEDMLSKSEQIMLDYAFRLALIELYMELSNNRSFIAFETSEGVLDAKHVVEFAKMLVKYSQKSKLICISNLHDEKFIQNLFDEKLSDIERLSKTLNFITMSSKEVEDIKFYKGMWKNIFGKEFILDE